MPDGLMPLDANACAGTLQHQVVACCVAPAPNARTVAGLRQRNIPFATEFVAYVYQLFQRNFAVDMHGH